MKWDMTKVVEEIAMQAKENQEEFIFETIRPYCENILQMKINKEELKRIILRDVRPKGKWLHIYKSDIACECSVCHIQMPITEYFHYCPNCGAEMEVSAE